MGMWLFADGAEGSVLSILVMIIAKE